MYLTALHDFNYWIPFYIRPVKHMAHGLRVTHRLLWCGTLTLWFLWSFATIIFTAQYTQEKLNTRVWSNVCKNIILTLVYFFGFIVWNVNNAETWITLRLQSVLYPSIFQYWKIRNEKWQGSVINIVAQYVKLVLDTTRNLFECDRPVFRWDIQNISGVSSKMKVKLSICLIYL
jgi:hypothetical protein